MERERAGHRLPQLSDFQAKKCLEDIFPGLGAGDGFDVYGAAAASVCVLSAS